MQRASPLIQKALHSLKIKELNEIQKASLKAYRNANNILLISPTGSGKTLSFLLPVLELLNDNKSGVQALILAPTRELALQIEQVFRNMKTCFKVNCCYGGHPIKVEQNSLKHPPALLIGTPGRIMDHIRRDSFDPTSIQILVLDEFDKSLELGFHGEMKYILEQMRGLKKRMLTSATQSVEIADFTGVSYPIILNYLNDENPKGLTVKRLMSDGNDKLDTLFRLLCKIGNEATLIFCNHREAVERISDLLHQKGLIHDIYHGGLKQEERERALIKFRNGSHKLLITTDLASRGLDIPEIRNVIHYQRATTKEAYTHRNGRTARMNEKGTAYLILAEEETLPNYLDDSLPFERVSDEISFPDPPQWTTLYIAGGKKNKINKIDIVGLLLKKGEIERDELGIIEVLDYSSYAAIKSKKIKQVLKLIGNERIKKKKIKIAISK